MKPEPPRPLAVAPWLRRLEQTAARVAEADDAEATHQLRVALARIRAWLWLGGHRVLRDDARWLRDAAQPLRDLDVQLELGVGAAERALADRRERARAQLTAALAAPRTRALFDALAAMPPIPTPEATAGAARAAKRAAALLENLDAPRPELDPLHDLRRAVRRLRYALEALGRDATLAIDLQSSLGDACDCMLALHSLGRSGPHRQGLAQRRDDALARARKQAARLEPALARLEKKA